MRSASFIAFAVWAAAFLQAQPPPPAAPPAQPPAAPAPAAPQGGGRQGSPASVRPPQSVSNDVYPAAQVAAGQALFASQCGFCHGRDAMGGETGPDLTRSQVVAEDVRGDKIGPIVHSGRPEKGMPPFAMSDTDLANVVAYIHDQKRKAESNEGQPPHGRRRRPPDRERDKGQQFFNGAGGCAKCHQPTGDFAGLATRLQGLQLLQRMLYPGGRGRGGKPPYAPTVTVTPPNGAPVTGRLTYRDEFTISLVDEAGGRDRGRCRRSRWWSTTSSQAHAALLPKYTDADMHDVLAYLQTLK